MRCRGREKSARAYHGWFLRRYDRTRGIQYLAFIAALPRLTIQPFDSAALVKTGVVVKKYSDHNLTLADAHGISIMGERKIAVCWSTDRHLALGGAALVA